jgi:hypothetical protein
MRCSLLAGAAFVVRLRDQRSALEPDAVRLRVGLDGCLITVQQLRRLGGLFGLLGGFPLLSHADGIPGSGCPVTRSGYPVPILSFPLVRGLTTQLPGSPAYRAPLYGSLKNKGIVGTIKPLFSRPNPS